MNRICNFLLLLLLSVSFLTGCKEQAPELHFVTELHFDVDTEKVQLIADVNGVPAEGEYWSPDSVSYRQNLKQGVVENVEYFSHAGHKLFARIEQKQKHFFSEDGKTITSDKAKLSYPEAYKEWTTQQASLGKIVFESMKK